jgi:hypothetical protein
LAGDPAALQEIKYHVFSVPFNQKHCLSIA